MNKNVIINKIKSFVGSDKEIITFAFVELYTTNKQRLKWLYSELSGPLCFIFDFKEKVRYFTLYDLNTYEVVFSYELYFDFDKYYQILSEDFHSFEVDSGMIGLKFSDKKEATMLALNIIKFDDMQSIQYFKNKNNKERDKVKDYNKEASQDLSLTKKCNIIKSKIMKKLLFSQNLNNKVDNSNKIEISTVKRFLLIKDLLFNKQKKLFDLDKVSADTKLFFNSIGIRKSDFANTYVALQLIRQILQISPNVAVYDEIHSRKRSRGNVTKHSRVSSHEIDTNRWLQLDNVLQNDVIPDDLKSKGNFIAILNSF